MISICLALLLGAEKPDAGPSPAGLSDVTFYDVTIQKVPDEELADVVLRFVDFARPGFVQAGSEMEFDRCTFTAAPAKDLFELELKCEPSSYPRKASWKWLGPGRAVTTLIEGTPTEVAVLNPSPEERRDALGLRLAARTLPAGAYKRPDGGLVFQLDADGGVRWGRGPTPGRFFLCMSDCAEGAREQLCLRLKDTGGASAVFEKLDGGMVGFAAESPGLCNGPEVWQAQHQLPPVIRRAK